MWFFFFNDTATTEIYTLSLHDALPIYLTDLEKMAARHPWLTVTPVVSDEPGFPGERGMLHEVLARGGNWRGHDVYASDRKSTRLKSSHSQISYAVFCLEKKDDS